jgi:hypothetical protein
MGKHGTGAIVGAVFGTLFMTVVFLAQPTVLPGGGDVLVEALLLGLLIGGSGGLFLGYLASRLIELGAAPPPRALPPPPRPGPAWPVHAVTGNPDLWAGLVLRCEGSVGRVSAAAQAVPDSPVKQWLNRIAFQFQQELPHVHDIARLARALHATDREHPALQRLLAATHDFAAFESEVGVVALKLLDAPELARARTDLEFLEQQLPSLGA